MRPDRLGSAGLTSSPLPSRQPSLFDRCVRASPGKRSFAVGSLVFRTKAEAKEHFRAMLWSYSVGSLIRGLDADELTALLGLHPHCEQKVGSGVAGYGVTLDPWKKPCFLVYRTDGASTDFSYRECISPKPLRRKFIGALRSLVATA